MTGASLTELITPETTGRAAALEASAVSVASAGAAGSVAADPGGAGTTSWGDAFEADWAEGPVTTGAGTLSRGNTFEAEGDEGSVSPSAVTVGAGASWPATAVTPGANIPGPDIARVALGSVAAEAEGAGSVARVDAAT